MTDSLINDYVSKRYKSWLDYSRYYCRMAKMEGEECDVLNEVLLSLLQKDEQKLLKLLEQPKDGYTALDWFVIRMLNRNITSPSSPYRQKRICRHIDRNVDYSKMKIEDIKEQEEDRPAEICAKMNKVRSAIDEIPLSPRARQIFSFRFFCGENFKEWEGPESLARLYEVYNDVSVMVKDKINNKSLF